MAPKFAGRGEGDGHRVGINADDRDYPHYHQSAGSVGADWGAVSSRARTSPPPRCGPTLVGDLEGDAEKPKKAPGHALEAVGTDLAPNLVRSRGSSRQRPQRRGI